MSNSCYWDAGKEALSHRQYILSIYVLYFVYAYTHTHSFNGPFSGTTQVGQYQKG